MRTFKQASLEQIKQYKPKTVSISVPFRPLSSAQDIDFAEAESRERWKQALALDWDRERFEKRWGKRLLESIEACRKAARESNPKALYAAMMNMKLPEAR